MKFISPFYGRHYHPDELITAITKSYEFSCSNYAVAYNFLQILGRLSNCDCSGIIDDYAYPCNTWVIFFTCRPQDEERLEYIAKHLPSSIEANIKFIKEDEHLC